MAGFRRSGHILCTLVIIIGQCCNQVTIIDLSDSLTHWLRPNDLDVTWILKLEKSKST